MIKSQDASLILSAASSAQFPETHKPEIVMVGKSNVGKSSLINALTRRKNLAFVGNTPGKTRLINFYDINENLLLIDVPGYGYANRSHKEQRDYAVLMDSYFELREPRLMLICVDIRRGIAEEDKVMIEFAEYANIPAVIVLTKTDKLSRSKMLQEKRKAENTTDLDVLLFSNVDHIHTDAIAKLINYSTKK